jgi:type IX secretion system PorP/SprF family membrane protein
MRIVFLFLLFLNTQLIYSQTRQVLGQYMLHQQSYNPGFSDPDTKFSINGIYKRQWVTQNNFPEAGIVYGHYNFDEGHSLGGVLSNDLMNNVNIFEAAVNYTYNIPVFNEANLGLGVRLGVNEQNLMNKNLIYFDPIEPVLANNTTFTHINVGTGISLTSPTFNFHLSAPYLFGNKYLNEANVYSVQGTHLYMNLGYKFRPRDDWFIIYPTALVTALEGTRIHGKFNVNFLTSQLVWTGIGISSDLSLNITAGIFAMGGLRVLYGVDASFLTSHNNTGITHEVSLSYAKTIESSPFAKKKSFNKRKGYRR